jgi:hypothetical protein
MATVNKDFRVKHGLIVEGTTGTINGNNILTDNDTSDAIGEGTTNLYYTDQRVKDVLTGSTQTNISITEVEGDLVITAESGIEDATTDDLDEGSTNLYFTDTRAVTAVENALVAETITTDEISEGTTNLYFTDQRAQDAVTTNLDTDDIDEGSTNLYYTDTRARAAVSGGTGIEYDDETGEIAVDTETIATKSYVDEVAEGLSVKPAVDVATTENITASYSNGTSGVGATLTIAATATLTIDGKDSWEQYDSVLFKNQTTPAHNGRYVLTTVGSAESSWVFTRCSLCDEADEIPGTYTFVKSGTLAGTGWVQIVDDPDTFTVGTDDIDVVQFSEASAYTGGTGITVDGTTIELDFTEFDTDDIDEGTTNLYYTTSRAKTDAAELLTLATLTNITITGDGDGLTITAENGVDDATTDDLSEGTTNLYHTAQRVRDVLTGSTQTNISITEVEGDLVITAENGLEDSTTDDLDEGTTNLYFTDQRAVDALESVVPNFDAVEVNSIAKQIAATVTLPTAEVVGTAYSFAHAEYRTAKFLVKMAAGSHTEVVEVLLTLDSSNNIAITQYAMVGTNGELGAIDAVLGGTGDADVLLRVEPNNNTTIVNVYGTLLV